MNSKTLAFIKANWALLLNPNVGEFAALIHRSPLQSVVEIMDELSNEPLTIQVLSDRLRMHPNSVAAITRILENKIFTSILIQQQRLVSLLPILDQTDAAEESDSPPVSQKFGKYLAVIPEGKHYHLLEAKDNKWIFEDNATVGVRVISPDPNPWEKEWTIVPFKQNQKSDASIWYYRVNFKLYSPSTCIPVVLERERYKGYFAYTQKSPIDYFNFYVGERDILSYSFYSR
ncbi:MAG: hypothetical protein MH252_07615 [Thermosynechococcaceae cyanobacterium MS004]|nr:hypothetical protein [Thermosynechococcaceae cyanobacterium MS004]